MNIAKVNDKDEDEIKKTQRERNEEKENNIKKVM